MCVRARNDWIFKQPKAHVQWINGKAMKKRLIHFVLCSEEKSKYDDLLVSIVCQWWLKKIRFVQSTNFKLCVLSMHSFGCWIENQNNRCWKSVKATQQKSFWEDKQNSTQIDLSAVAPFSKHFYFVLQFDFIRWHQNLKLVYRRQMNFSCVKTRRRRDLSRNWFSLLYFLVHQQHVFASCNVN